MRRTSYNMDTNINRMLPQSSEAEQAVLGSMVLDADNIVRVMDIMQEDDFYEDKHKKIYNVICFLYAEKQAVDYLTICQRLEDLGETQNVGGAAYVAQLVNNTPTTRHVDTYAKLVHHKGLLRRIIETGHRIVNSGYGEKDAKEVGQLIMDLEEQVSNYRDLGNKKNHKATDVVDELFEEIHEFASGKRIVKSTGFESLDEVVSGYIIPHVWIIGGYTGVGKSFFTLCLMLNLLRNGMKIVMFSTENSRTRNVLRLLGAMTGFSEMKLYKGKFTEEELKKINDAKEEIKKFNLIIYDSVFDTEGIWLKTKRHRLVGDVELVVVDYIQNLNQSSSDVYKQMSYVSLQMQKMAIELNVGFLGVSQIANSEMEKKSSSITSFKGAGEISAIADVTIRLMKSKSDPTRMLAKLQKVRHGLSGKVLEFEFFSESLLSSGRYIAEAKEE